MILTDYYALQKATDSKTRYNCTYSTKSYEPFEMIAARAKGKKFFCHYMNNTYCKSDKMRQAEKALTNGKHISSIYVPNLENGKHLFAYGDCKGTTDALLFKFSADYDEIDVYVARGMKHNARHIFDLFANGDLDTDIANLLQMLK